MKNDELVSKIMSTKLVTLCLNDDLVTAEKLFKKNKIRHIPVVQGDEIIGMLSYTDILRISFADVSDDEKNVDSFVYDMFTIKQVMTKNIFKVPSTATVREVAELLKEKEFHALPVVDENELVGIVTTTDLIEYLMEKL